MFVLLMLSRPLVVYIKLEKTEAFGFLRVRSSGVRESAGVVVVVAVV